MLQEGLHAVTFRCWVMCVYFSVAVTERQSVGWTEHLKSIFLAYVPLWTSLMADLKVIDYVVIKILCKCVPSVLIFKATVQMWAQVDLIVIPLESVVLFNLYVTPSVVKARSLKSSVQSDQFLTENIHQALLNTVMWNRALDSKNTRWWGSRLPQQPCF